jgi:hypothetical protein
MDTDLRAERVEAVTRLSGGKVISRDGDEMIIEIRADIAPGLHTLWGMSGFVPIFQGQDTRPAPRMVTDGQGKGIFCEGDEVTTAFYRYLINLRDDDKPVEMTPHAGAIAITIPRSQP